MFKISNKPLSKLDEQVALFYKLNARYFNQMINQYGLKIFKKEAKSILRQLDKLKLTNDFDVLVARNIRSNITIQDTVIDYFTDFKFSLPPEKFIDRIAGRGSWKYLEHLFVNSPWETRWHQSENSLERGFSLADERTKEAQDLAQQMIPQIKQDILDYGVTHGYLPPDFEFQLYLLPPSDGEQYSRWNSKARVFEMGNYGFVFFHDHDQVKMCPTVAYIVSFHEIIGHAAQQVRSQSMPASLQFNEEIASLTAIKSTVEGVAEHASCKSYSYIADHLSRLKIPKIEYDYIINRDQIVQQNQLEYLFLSLLKDKETRDKNFSGYKYIKKVTKNPMLARFYKHNFKDEFFDQWGVFGHCFGPRHFALMQDKVIKKYDQKYLQANQNKFNQATLSGVWSWEVYPDAVTWMMENVK